MRSNSLARLVTAGLAVSVGITLGCGGDLLNGPNGPSPWAFSVLSISPPEGPMAAGTIVRIAGNGFQTGDTVTVDGVTVDGSRVEAQTPSGGSSIFFAMPAHAAGKVNVTVI